MDIDIEKVKQLVRSDFLVEVGKTKSYSYVRVDAVDSEEDVKVSLAAILKMGEMFNTNPENIQIEIGCDRNVLYIYFMKPQ